MNIRSRLSLSQRLLAGLFIVSFAYWIVIAGLTIKDTVDETHKLLNANLVQTALALLRVTDPDDDDSHETPVFDKPPPLKETLNQWLHLPERLDKIQTRGLSLPSQDHALRYQIWNNEGQLLLRSTNTTDAVLTEQDGFSESTDKEGVIWRSYGTWDRHHHFRILVSESRDTRNRLVRNISLHLISPLVLGLPVLIFLLWLSINRGLEPLDALTREIGQRKFDNLTPLDADSAPEDMRPMVLALNDLLRRMTHFLENERLFTANAAHELRTPLAAIQSHLYAARAASGRTEQLHALNQLQRSVERGARLVGQLLTLARLDPEQCLPDAQPMNLGHVAQTVCAELAPQALQRDQSIELQVEPDLPPLPGNVGMIEMLLCNLLDNAIRYTPCGGHIHITVRRDAARLSIAVSDDGPGIPTAQRQRVFDRFYRIAGQDQPGTGLGLAICRHIAELHYAKITFASGPNDKGLIATVSF